MTVAVKIVDRALRSDFGFKHILWVYSGRRGVHCWVCDARARSLSNDMRAAIAEYLTVIKGSDHNVQQVKLNYPLHPSIEAAVEIAEDYFQQVILDEEMQDVLGTDETREKVLAIVGHEGAVEKARALWDVNPGASNRDRWTLLCEAINEAGRKDIRMRTRKQEIILQYTYPRLDVNVSKQLNHLLKSPFVVHPKTGRS